MSRIAEQRRRAAARGTEVRSRRAVVKRLIAEGNSDLVELLQAKPDERRFYPIETAEEIPIGQLLRSVPGFGPATVKAIVADLAIDPERPMGELTDKQRRDVAAEIERT